MSIGIDYKAGAWKTCLTENGQTLELRVFEESDAILSYIEETCALYPEPVIALSSSLATTLRSLQALAHAQEPLTGIEQPEDFYRFLIGIQILNLKNYHLPALKNLKSIPRYRKLNRKDMGDADKLCSVATLLYRMRQQDASWPEMRFLYLEVGREDRSIVVVKDGCIVDGMRSQVALESEDDDANERDREQAFWEGLSQDVAGLMAIHHFEDIVVIDRRFADTQVVSQSDSVIDRLGDTYQFYLFPHDASEPEGFETAIGAALIAEGLYRPGLASEVVERLQVQP